MTLDERSPTRPDAPWSRTEVSQCKGALHESVLIVRDARLRCERGRGCRLVAHSLMTRGAVSPSRQRRLGYGPLARPVGRAPGVGPRVGRCQHHCRVRKFSRIVAMHGVDSAGLQDDASLSKEVGKLHATLEAPRTSAATKFQQTSSNHCRFGRSSTITRPCERISASETVSVARPRGRCRTHRRWRGG